MNILHITGAKTWRGGEQQLIYLCTHSQQDHHIVLSPQNSSMTSFCQKNEITNYTYKKWVQNIFLGSRISGLCKKLSIDIVHCHDSHSHQFALYASIFFSNRTPIILTRRVDFKIKNNFLKRYKYNHKNIKAIATVSQKIRQILLPVLKDGAVLKVIYSGIDLKKFNNGSSSSKSELSIPDDKKIIAKIAAIAPHKDHETFLKTAQYILEKDPQFHFLIIGSGDEDLSALKRLAKRLSISKSVSFMGFRQKIESYFQHIDLIMMTSKEEGLNTSILDAFAAQVPVVCTEAGGMPEIVKDGKTGLLAPIGDYKTLGEKAIMILQNDEDKKRIVATANDFVQQFTVERMATEYHRLYKDVLELESH